MASFEDLINKLMDEIKPPPLMPVGSYLVGITGVPEQVKSSQKGTPGFQFNYKFFQARADVDRDELTTALADRNLTDIEMKDTFYITENSLFMLKQFLEDVLEIQAESLKQAIAEASGKQLIIHVTHRPRQDGSGLRSEIDTRAKAD